MINISKQLLMPSVLKLNAHLFFPIERFSRLHVSKF